MARKRIRPINIPHCRAEILPADVFLQVLHVPLVGVRPGRKTPSERMPTVLLGCVDPRLPKSFPQQRHQTPRPQSVLSDITPPVDRRKQGFTHIRRKKCNVANQYVTSGARNLNCLDIPVTYKRAAFSPVLANSFRPYWRVDQWIDGTGSRIIVPSSAPAES